MTRKHEQQRHRARARLLRASPVADSRRLNTRSAEACSVQRLSRATSASAEHSTVCSPPCPSTCREATAVTALLRIPPSNRCSGIDGWLAMNQRDPCPQTSYSLKLNSQPHACETEKMEAFALLLTLLRKLPFPKNPCSLPQSGGASTD
jgi:hypothetical protein